MKALLLRNGNLEEKEIENKLEVLQEIVGGYIEVPYLGDVFRNNEIDVIINEEGKFIDGLRSEIAIVGKGSGAIIDVVYGNCIFASHDEYGNTIGLNDKQIDIIKNSLELSAVLELKNKKELVRVLFV